MSKADKIQFINELVESIRKDAVKAVEKMPDDWDGHELRAYLASRFIGATSTLWHRPEGRLRVKAFKNTCIVNNL